MKYAECEKVQELKIPAHFSHTMDKHRIHYDKATGKLTVEGVPTIYAKQAKSGKPQPGQPQRMSWIFHDNDNIKPRSRAGRKVGTYTVGDREKQLEVLQKAQEHLREMAETRLAKDWGFIPDTDDAADIGFLAWIEERIKRTPNYVNGSRKTRVLQLARDIFPASLKLKDVSKRHGEQLKRYLLQTLPEQDTARTYLGWIKAQLKLAVTDYELLPTHPWQHVTIPMGNYRNAPHKKKYLSKDQVKLLQQVPLKRKQVPSLTAFFFATRTGAGLTDIRQMTHGNIRRNDDGTGILTYVRAKTRNNKPMTATVPLSVGTLQLIGPELAFNSPLFPHLASDVTINKHLNLVATAAGLKRPVTFYEGRHSFVCNSILDDVPLTVLMRRTGHGQLITLQRYADSLELDDTSTAMDY